MLKSNIQRVVARVHKTIFTVQCSPLPSCKKNYKESLFTVNPFSELNCLHHKGNFPGANFWKETSRS